MVFWPFIVSQAQNKGYFVFLGCKIACYPGQREGEKLFLCLAKPGHAWQAHYVNLTPYRPTVGGWGTQTRVDS